MTGKQILQYKILEALGRGGMGVVYKAEDTKLNRTVALKFLPADKLGGGDEKQRFEQEAKAAAQLNHANIATVYEINEHDGQIFIAMEFIEGETIAEKVQTRPLKNKDAVKIAKQIAEGLRAAHERGIVHRDIKSGNIMVTEKGVVKIMDFGLAKMSQASMVTKAGTTLGTISYMSPEQARGEELDKRSDIWSLGVVLYEMIAGRLPFKGDDEQAVIYSILNEEPEPLTALRSGLPIALDGIVAKALAKDPDTRYQHVDELPADLKNVSLEDTTTSRIGSAVITDSVHRDKELNVTVKYSYKTVLTIAATAAITFLLTWFFKPAPAPPEAKPVNRMVVHLPEDVNLNYSSSNRMAISPDGTNLVYVARAEGQRRLYLKSGRSFESRYLTGTDGGVAPFFSPDGRWIGYFNGRNRGIYKVLVDGGEPFKVTDFTENRSGATWAPDHTIIFPYDGGLRRVPESGGEATILTEPERPGEEHSFPLMLPDGQTVLFTVATRDAELNTFRLAVYSFGDDDYRIILDEEGYNAVYSATGHLLYGRAGRFLMAVPFDLQNLTISGVPVPVLDNVHTNARYAGMSYALSNEGTLIYVPGTGTDHDLRSVLTVDLSGQATDFFDLKRRFSLARYSPDGKYVAFIIEEENAANIWIYHIDGGAINKLTFYEGDGVRFLAWSPDSKSVAYGTTAEDSTNSLYIKRIDGSGSARRIDTSPDGRRLDVDGWSADGGKITFDQPRQGGHWDRFVYSFADSSATALLSTPAFEVQPLLSPNGKWFAYQSNESGQSEVYVRSGSKGSGGVWKLSDGGGEDPVWAPNGEKIYYKNGDAIYAVRVTATEMFSKGNPKKIFEGNYFFPNGRRWDIHPDGDRFIMIQSPEGEQTPGAQKIFVIQNFDEELKRLVRTGKD